MDSFVPPVPVLFSADKLRRFRTLDDDAYALKTYLANEEAQIIISEAVEAEDSQRDPAQHFKVCQRALVKFPYSVDAFLEVAYLYETQWNDLEKAKTAYDRAIKCCGILWPDLEEQALCDGELHEMRLLQQAYFGLANVELDLGNVGEALAHVTTLQRLDPDDISGYRQMFYAKYNAIDEEPLDRQSQDSSTDSFYNEDSGAEGEDASSVDTELSDEFKVQVSNQASQEVNPLVSVDPNDEGDHLQVYDDDQDDEPIVQEQDVTPPSSPTKSPRKSPSKQSARQVNEIPKTIETLDIFEDARSVESDEPLPPLLSKPMPSPVRKSTRAGFRAKPAAEGVCDKTLATSYFLSANVSLENGNIDAALEHVRNLLKADPKDECGCLWKFFERFVRENFEEDDIEQILSGGPSSCECYFRYCFIILDIMKMESGSTTFDKVQETIVRALVTNPLVPELLLSEDELPDCSTQQVAGGMSEAIWYVGTDRETWNGVEEALQFLQEAQFQNGPKPKDDGSILRNLLSLCNVIVDLKLPGRSTVESYECTARGEHSTRLVGLADDPSDIVCYGIPVALDGKGRRFEGRYLSFSWEDVQRVHFWDILHSSKFMVERSFSIHGSSYHTDQGEAERPTYKMQPSEGGTSIDSLPSEVLVSRSARAEKEFNAACEQLEQEATEAALEHVRTLLEVDPVDEYGFLVKFFRAFIRNSFDEEDILGILPASWQNAEVYFRWCFIVLDKMKLDAGKLTEEEFDETIVRALARNGFVPSILLKGEKTSKRSGPFPPGSVKEAMWYVNSDLETWKGVPEALDALLLTRFRDGLKPHDDGALLLSLLERCKLIIDVTMNGQTTTYECSSRSQHPNVPKEFAQSNDASKISCFAVPAQLGNDGEQQEGRWISFTYESVERVPFWKILIDSKYLVERKPSLLRDGSDGSIGSNDSMLRRALRRSSLSNSSLLSDSSNNEKEVTFVDGFDNPGTPMSRRRKESVQEVFQKAENELVKENIDEAMEQIRRLLELDPQDESCFVAKIFRLFVEKNFEEDEIEEVLVRGKDSAECFFRYSFVVLDHMRRVVAECTTKSLEDTLTRAIQTNPFVPELLLKKESPPVTKITPIPGELSEAIFYVNTDSGTWQCVKGALDWLRKTRFRHGMKPNDDGTILRDILLHGKVIVDVTLSGDETVTYECTSCPAGLGEPPQPQVLKDDASKIVCYATPAELGFRGKRRAGKLIAFSYSSVERVHYWHVLYHSREFTERRLNSSHSSLNSGGQPSDMDDTSSTEFIDDSDVTEDGHELAKGKSFWSMRISSVSKSMRSVLPPSPKNSKRRVNKSNTVSSEKLPTITIEPEAPQSPQLPSRGRVKALRQKLFAKSGSPK